MVRSIGRSATPATRTPPWVAHPSWRFESRPLDDAAVASARSVTARRSWRSRPTLIDGPSPKGWLRPVPHDAQSSRVLPSSGIMDAVDGVCQFFASRLSLFGESLPLRCSFMGIFVTTAEPLRARRAGSESPRVCHPCAAFDALSRPRSTRAGLGSPQSTRFLGGALSTGIHRSRLGMDS